MNIRHIGILLGKEFRYGMTNYFFIFALIAPLLFTLVINLVFGTLLSGKPKLGIYDRGSSRVTGALGDMTSIRVKTFSSEESLKQAVASGKRDVGVVFETDFDERIKSGSKTRLTLYIWGESLLKDRAIIGSAIMHQVRPLSGAGLPVTIETVSLGDENAVSLKERMLPLVVLLSVFIAGFVIPSTSLVEEKEKRTAGAVLSTPVTVTELYLTKGLVGFVLSLFMGTSILALNQGFGTQPHLTMLILMLGAVMAACVGLMTGSLVGNIATMYTVIKMLGLVLYGPGIVALFPGLPTWIGKIFPTYYVMHPVMQISLHQAGWPDIRNEICILIGILVIMIAATGLIASRTRQMEA